MLLRDKTSINQVKQHDRHSVNRVYSFLIILLISTVYNICHCTSLYAYSRGYSYPKYHIQIYEQERVPDIDPRVVDAGAKLIEAAIRYCFPQHKWQCLLPVKFNTREHVFLGIGIGGNNNHTSKWIEGHVSKFIWWVFPEFTHWYEQNFQHIIRQEYFENKALCQPISETSIGFGSGRTLNSWYALKLYMYQDFTTKSLRNSPSGIAHMLNYSTLRGGIEIQAPYYRININAKKNSLTQDRWTRANREDEDSASGTIEHSFYKDQKNQGHYEILFRKKVDLIERGHWGFSSQIQWECTKALQPSIGVYYNRVHFISPPSYSKILKNYTAQFNKGAYGVHCGFDWLLGLGYAHATFTVSIDNCNGPQGVITLTIPSLIPQKSKHLLSYRSPMRYIGPLNYTKKILPD